ncbi:putative membrane protein [Brevibacterium sanguinis]|uniref:Membrane protein n=2 Tax=Brevibacterium TaxID=1696 RepID=A0ABX9GPM2_9MICO|nr:MULTISPECIES: YhgE/Pip domain-containing protein [Brevibacterium]RBP62498.1 putative membrane protein [Brevibacterium sanguinis]RBP69162.1 putative membrane protein [Brevibacterium celere]
MRLERANSKRPVTWVSFLGLVLIPIIVAAGFILATWKSGDRLDSIDAAIVNADEGAEVDGQTVPLGRQLTSGLVSEEDTAINWEITDAETAEQGLADGTFAAALTIPEGFSRAVTSVEDASTATQTRIDVDVSEVAPAADTLISQAIAEAARTTFNTEMTKTYLDSIYVGFNEMGTQMRDLGEAAGELEKGTDELSRGTSEAATGAGELAAGMTELDTAGGELATGAGDLESGVGDLAAGTSELATGLDEAATGTKDLPESTDKLADGADELSTGVDEYTKSIDEIIEGFAGSGDTGGGDLGQVVDGAQGLSRGLHDYRDGLVRNADDARTLMNSGQVTGLDSLVDAGLLTSGEAKQVRAQLCPEGTPAETCAGLERAYATGLLGGTSGALDQAAAGLEEERDGVSLLSGIEELATGLEDGLGELTEGMESIADNADELLEASQGLRSGAASVAEGNRQLADGMPGLADGIAQAAEGSAQLDEGAGQLSDGMGEFRDGLDQYVAGVSSATTGTGDLATGLTALSDGTTELDEGMGTFSEGVQKGAEEVPSYTAPERDTLAEVVSSSIESPDDRGVPDLLQGTTIALLIMLALWIGGIVTYTVLRPVQAAVLLSTESSPAIWLRGLAPGLLVGAVQAVVLSSLATTVLDVDTTQAVRIVLLTFASALVFMIFNFALVAWLGGVGRFVSVIALVLAVAGRTIGAVPEFFAAVAPLLPLTPAMNGFAAIAGGTTGAGAACAGLLAWAVIGGVASLLAIVRARTTKPEVALAMA